MFFLMQNIFIVPAMQHGCRAKPLLVICFLGILFQIVDLISTRTHELSAQQVKHVSLVSRDLHEFCFGNTGETPFQVQFGMN